MWQGVVLVGIFSIFWILYRNHKYKKKSVNTSRELILNLFFVYVLTVVFLTMQPFLWNNPFDFTNGKMSYHFDFQLFYQLRHMSSSKLQILYSVGNIAMFIPFGLLVPLLFQHCQRLWLILLLGFSTSLTIELIQTFFTMTRRGTLDDLVFNTSGAVIGYSLFVIIRAAWKRIPAFHIAK